LAMAISTIATENTPNSDGVSSLAINIEVINCNANRTYDCDREIKIELRILGFGMLFFVAIRQIELRA